jgi:hypothetical protein
VIAHSGKEDAAATWKKTYGHHPLTAFVDHGPDGPRRPGGRGHPAWGPPPVRPGLARHSPWRLRPPSRRQRSPSHDRVSGPPPPYNSRR